MNINVLTVIQDISLTVKKNKKCPQDKKMSFGFGAGANSRKKFRRAAPKEDGTKTLDINGSVIFSIKNFFIRLFYTAFF